MGSFSHKPNVLVVYIFATVKFGMDICKLSVYIGKAMCMYMSHI